VGLAQQLIAAKLNLANGSNATTIQSTIDHADSLLAGRGRISGGSRVNPTSALGLSMAADAAILATFNQGGLV
jgi:hypothetical protein